MTRAEYLLVLHAQLYVLRRLDGFAKLSPLDREQLRAWEHEYAEEKRRMGGSDRRQFAALLAAWTAPLPAAAAAEKPCP